MKNTRALLSCIAVCITLTVLAGCSNVGAEATSETETEAEGKIHSLSVFEYDQERMQMLSRQTPLAIAEAGYYYIVEDILYFYDVNSGESAPLCSRTDCDHKGENCSAHVYTTNATIEDPTQPFIYACNCMDHMIAYYDGKLFMIERTQENEFYLCRYDSNFSNKERLALLASDVYGDWVVEADAAVISEGYLYYYVRVRPEPDEPLPKPIDYSALYQCRRIKLDQDAEPEVLGEFDYASDHALALGDDDGTAIYVCGDNVYYTAQGVVRWYSDIDPVQFRIARYNTVTENFELLMTYTGNSRMEILGEGTGFATQYTTGKYSQMDEQGNLYFLTANTTQYGYDSDGRGVLTLNTRKQLSQNIVKMDPESQTAGVIYTTRYGQIYPMRCDGKYLYFFETDNTPGSEASYLTVIDTDGNVVVSREMEYTETYLEKYDRALRNYLDENLILGKPVASEDNIVIYAVDDRYLWIGTYNDIFKGLPAAARNSYYGHANGKLLGEGVISREQLLGGEDLESIQLYQYGK